MKAYSRQRWSKQRDFSGKALETNWSKWTVKDLMVAKIMTQRVGKMSHLKMKEKNLK